MGNKESKHQSLFSLESWFKNNHGINFQESSSLTLFKSLVAFLPPSSGESYLNEAKVITSSKLIGALNEDIRLKINPHIAFIHEQESLENPDNQIQGFRTISSTIEFDTSTRLAFIELLPYLNGDYAIKEIANIYSTSETEVMHVLQPFYEIGFLVLCSKSLVPAISFYTHLMSSERGKRLNNITPLDTNRDKEDLKSSLVRNLFAHYYYAFSFSDHLSVTISQTNNYELKEQLCSIVSECYWYSNMLLKGIGELGYTKKQIKQLIPCSSTLGVINYLRWLAKIDLLSYSACLGILEYPEVSADASHTVSSFIQAEWEQIEALNLVQKEALEPFRKQKKLEFLSQKSHLSKCFFEAESYLTPERQVEIKKHVHGFIQCLRAEASCITGNYK